MLRIQRLTSLFVLLCSFGYVVAECPPPNLIRPCTCVPNNHINCGQIHSMDTLVDMFKRSGDRMFEMFTLYNSSLMYLPASSISSKQFNNLLLVNVSMTSLFNQPPSEANMMTMMMLKNVTFQRGIGWEFFKPIKHLGLFYAEFTEIKSIGKGFVDNINSGLKFLTLKTTRTRKIQHNAFSKMRRLTELTVLNSEIKTLQRSMFAVPAALKEINFSGNKIESLPEDIFLDMPVLRHVYLNFNKLTVLSGTIFSNLYRRGVDISVFGNPLRCDCKMLWYVLAHGKKIIVGRCQEPEDKRGKLLRHLTKADFSYCPRSTSGYNLI